MSNMMPSTMFAIHLDGKNVCEKRFKRFQEAQDYLIELMRTNAKYKDAYITLENV